jgi:hypothetical protein
MQQVDEREYRALLIRQLSKLQGTRARLAALSFHVQALALQDNDDTLKLISEALQYIADEHEGDEP